MQIKVDIFDDGLEPVTCARDAIECQFLKNYRSLLPMCKLFNTRVKIVKLDILYNTIIPCPECMQARAVAKKKLQETKK